MVADRLRDAAAGAWLDIARAQVQRHDDAGAGKAFAEARAVLPSDGEALAAEASWLENRGQTEPARALYLQLLAQRPEAPEVLAALARLALLDGDGATLDAHRRKLLDLAANLTPWDGASREGDDDRSEVAGALLKLAIPLLGRAAARRRRPPCRPRCASIRNIPSFRSTARWRWCSGEGPCRGRWVSRCAEDPRRAQVPVTPPLLGGDPEALSLDAQVQAALARGKAGETQESMRRVRALFAAHPADEGVALGLLEAFERAGKRGRRRSARGGNPRASGERRALLCAGQRAGPRRAAHEALATMRKVLSLQPQHPGRSITLDIR